jgi:hypothetical protein
MIFLTSTDVLIRDIFPKPVGVTKSAEELFPLIFDFEPVLAVCPEITRIIIVNFEDYPITVANLKRFTKSAFLKNKIAKLSPDMTQKVTDLILNTAIFTKEDLGISKPKNVDKLDLIYDGLSFTNFNMTKLNNFINNDKVVTFSNLFSYKISTILHGIPDVDIYKSSYLSNADRHILYTKVEDTKAYIEFYNKLIQEFFTSYVGRVQLKVPESFFECFDLGYPNLMSTHQFYTEISDVLAGKNMKINIVGEEYYIVKKLVEELGEYGRFSQDDGLRGKIDIDSEEKGVAIFNANKLAPEEFSKINHDIFSNKSADKYYILHSTEPLENLLDSSFTLIFLPSIEQIKTIWIKLILIILKKVFSIEDNEYIASLYYYLNNRVIHDTLMIIPSLEKVEYLFKQMKFRNSFSRYDFRDKDFWYDFMVYIKTKPWDLQTKVNKSNKNHVTPDSETLMPTLTEIDKEIWASIKHVDKNTVWRITAPGMDEVIIEGKPPLGLLYAVYLIEHFSDETGVEATVLRDTIYKWKYGKIRDKTKKVSAKKVPAKKVSVKKEGKVERTSGEIDFHSIEGALTDFFKKQYSDLKKLRDYFTINSCCHFDPKIKPHIDITCPDLPEKILDTN